MSGKKIFFVVNVDWFFLSHRLELAEALLRDGNQVYILTRDTGKKKVIIDHGFNFIDIPFDRSGANPLREIMLVYHLYRVYKRLKPDIIHQVTIKPAVYGSLVFKFLKRGKCIIVNAISGLGYNFIDNRTSFTSKFLLALMNFGFKSPGVNFIFQNPDDVAFYKKLNYLNDDNHLIIKGAGVNHIVFQYHEPTKKEKIRVVLTARMLLDKGIVEYLEAARQLYPKYANLVQFYLVGDIDVNNKASASAELINSYLIDDYIIWSGHRSDIKEILIESDIVCLPSYREGLPKSLIEAMAIGRPIVTTDVPGCRECVIDQYNGFLVKVKSADALAEKFEILFNNSELRIEMGKNSRKKMVKELSLETVISETKAFYNKLLNK